MKTGVWDVWVLAFSILSTSSSAADFPFLAVTPFHPFHIFNVCVNFHIPSVCHISFEHAVKICKVTNASSISSDLSFSLFKLYMERYICSEFSCQLWIFQARVLPFPSLPVDVSTDTQGFSFAMCWSLDSMVDQTKKTGYKWDWNNFYNFYNKPGCFWAVFLTGGCSIWLEVAPQLIEPNPSENHFVWTGGCCNDVGVQGAQTYEIASNTFQDGQVWWVSNMQLHYRAYRRRNCQGLASALMVNKVVDWNQAM